MSVIVRVPASTSNLGAGFDCVGIAVDRWLRVTVRIDAESSRDVTIDRAGTLRDVSLPAREDLLYAACVAAAGAGGAAVPHGLVFEADSDIPLGRGLGSSAAAIVAGAVAARSLLGLELNEQRLLSLAAGLDGHPDNVAAAINGGAVLVLRAAGQPVVTPLNVHPSLTLVFAVPDFAVATARARAALPASLPHRVAADAVARGAALVTGLGSGDRGLLSAGLDDVLHVPYRRALIPGYDAVTEAARTAGAVGATLSGSGSSIVAVTSPERSAAVGAAMVAAWRGAGIAAESFSVTERIGGYSAERLASIGEPVSSRPVL